jgi:putative membrane protein
MERLPAIAVRGVLGGILMGLANLVPGISGGTMLLATGVYTAFVDAIAELSTFRFRARSLVFLGAVALAALLAIGALAGPVKDLVETRTWIMYSLFIGLTLGGVPIVWRRARPASAAVWLGAAAGFALMAVVAFNRGEGQPAGGFAVLFVAGVAGAGAMVLPGISGAYMLLVLGQYERILGAIRSAKEWNLGAAWPVLLPVGLGVAAGILAVSNLIRWALRRHEKPTLGVLLGLLLGSVLGIWPFQEPVHGVDPRSYFTPTPTQIGLACALVVAGFLTTLAIDRLGRAE